MRFSSPGSTKAHMHTQTSTHADEHKHRYKCGNKHNQAVTRTKAHAHHACDTTHKPQDKITQSHTNTQTHTATSHQGCKPHHHHNSETLPHLRPARHNPPGHIIVQTHNTSKTNKYTHMYTPKHAHACIQAIAK